MLAASGAVLCALAAVSAAVALPTTGAAKRAPIAAASCAPLTLAPGKAGLIRLTPKKGSLKIVATRLAPGVKATTKQRKISRLRVTTYRYAFRLTKGVRGERVRLLVSFGKGRKVLKKKVVACTVRVGAATLSLKVTVSGPGTVTSSPAGITCTAGTSPCTKSFKRGARVRLTASAEATADFAGWNGSCKGSAACSVSLTAARTVGATFARKRFAVSVEKAGEGGGTVNATEGAIACGATCTDTYEAGTIVRLRAEPDGNSRFVGWSGACSSTASICIFTVDGITSATATFAKQGFRMAVSRASNGGGTISAQPDGVNCGSTCSYTYPAGTTVTLTATPDSTSLFAGWIGDCVSSGNTCTTTMDNAKFIAAAFHRGIRVTVAVNAADHPAGAGNGTGTIVSSPAGISCQADGSGTCSALFYPNAAISLFSTPATGSSFSDWYRCSESPVPEPGPPSGGRCDISTPPSPTDGSAGDLGRTIVARFTTP